MTMNRRGDTVRWRTLNGIQQGVVIAVKPDRVLVLTERNKHVVLNNKSIMKWQK